MGNITSLKENDLMRVEACVCVSPYLMHYLINLSEETDHLLRQLCNPHRGAQTKPLAPEDFLSAFVEEQFDDLFARREGGKSGQNNEAKNAVRSAKEQAEAWSEATIATHTALQAMEKLVRQATASP